MKRVSYTKQCCVGSEVEESLWVEDGELQRFLSYLESEHEVKTTPFGVRYTVKNIKVEN